MRSLAVWALLFFLGCLGANPEEAIPPTPKASSQAESPLDRPLWLKEPSPHVAPVDLMIAVVSAVGYADRRNSIRETWATELYGIPNGRVLIRFVVGMPPMGAKEDNDQAREKLLREQQQFGDLLQVTSIDTYSGLTHKTMTTVILVNRVYNPKFFMKCDDDSYVNVPLVWEELFNTTGAPSNDSLPLYWGWFHSKPEVRTDLSDKNHDTYTDAGGVWPTYASGSGYVLSREVMVFLSAFFAGPLQPRLYRNEDASLGLWLQGAALWRKNDNRFNLPKCEPGFLVHHPTTPAMMRILFKYAPHGVCPPTPTTVFPEHHFCLLWLSPASILPMLVYYVWISLKMRIRMPVKLI